MTGKRCYYLSDYSDEVMPCEPSLQGWADWLATPDRDWGRNAPALDGETFKASVLRFEDDIVANKAGDGWAFSRDPDDADFLAVRFGPGLGWDAESIVGDAAGLRDWLAENDSHCEAVEHIAVAMSEPGVIVTFHAGPPASCTAEVPA